MMGETPTLWRRNELTGEFRAVVIDRAALRAVILASDVDLEKVTDAVIRHLQGKEGDRG